MKRNVDVLIIGTGISGLYCALNLHSNLNVLLVTKSKMSETNTYLAQGGISTARNKNDIPTFIEDTLKAGQYKNDVQAVKVLAEESMENILCLESLGVTFDKDGSDFLFTREGAHCINRIVHCKDSTGKFVAEALIEQIKKRSNITVYEDTYLLDILTNGDTCIGGIVARNNEQFEIHAKMVVLATGGIGGLFSNSTSQRHLTGDGISIALRHNIRLKDMEYIQFHPTAFYDGKSDSRKFLISEAVRGEGGKLYNSKGERFVDELLPRDVVTSAIHEEIKKTGIPYVSLDISFKDKNYIKTRFPQIYNECLNRGIDITTQTIPVAPAQHYFMGGIEVNLDSKTSMNNLFAVGEISCTGIHGANRLASNSLLEGLVFSKRAAAKINSDIDDIKIIDIPSPKIQFNVESTKIKNRKLTIDEFKRRSKKLNDELFSY